ncbi:UEV domain-containing protein [Mycena galericulata]|nr:UEV domain-containing protein [Mycena galericulata]
MSQLSLTQKWLRENVASYGAAERVFADIDTALSRFPSLRPKSDVYTYDDGRTQLLLCVHGLLPISYRNASYNIPIAVWLTRDFPREPPLPYVVPTADMLVKPGPRLDVSGRSSVDYVQQWARKSEGCSLPALLDAMQAEFSKSPPVYAKPAATAPPPPSRPASQPPQPPNRPGQPPSLPPKPLTPSQAQYAPQYAPQPAQTPQYPPQGTHTPQYAQVGQQSSQTPQYSAEQTPQQAPSLDLGPGALAARPPPPLPPHPRADPGPPQYRSPPGYQAPPAPWTPPREPQPPPQPHWAPAHPAPPPPAPAPQPIPDLLDEDAPAPNVLYAPQPSLPGASPAPPRPPNPELLRLHAAVHAKFSTELASLGQALALDAERLRAHQADLLAGEPAIRDEMGRLEAVRDVCRTAAGRMRGAVEAGERNVAELRAKSAPAVDELVCSTTIVHNQLINLVAEDNAIEDTIFHLSKALNSGRIDLERFLRSCRLLAEEQFMKRALIEKIQNGIPMGQGVPGY